MSLFFRHSFRRGPIRLNLSGHGVGASVGIPGFRVGLNTRGRYYVQAGAGGVYYRTNLGEGQHPPPAPLPSRDERDLREGPAATYAMPSAAGFQSSARQEIVAALASAERKAPLLLWGSIAVAVMGCLLCFVSVLLGILLVVAGVSCSIPAYRHEMKSRQVWLEYRLSQEERTAFSRLVDGLNHLASCASVWAVDADRHLATDHQRKLNAGAGSVVDRHNVGVGEGVPRFLMTNVPVPCIRSGTATVYFLPDFFLIHDGQSFGHCAYTEVQVEAGEVRFVEEVAPADAQVVDRTWRYPNKSGGPDKRFADNAEIPICLYGSIRMAAQNRTVLLLEASRLGVAAEVADAVHQMRQVTPAPPPAGQHVPARPKAGAAVPPASVEGMSDEEILRRVEAEEKAKFAALKQSPRK